MDGGIYPRGENDKSYCYFNRLEIKGEREIVVVSYRTSFLNILSGISFVYLSIVQFQFLERPRYFDEQCKREGSHWM